MRVALNLLVVLESALVHVAVHVLVGSLTVGLVVLVGPDIKIAVGEAVLALAHFLPVSVAALVVCSRGIGVLAHTVELVAGVGYTGIMSVMIKNHS